MAMITLSDPSGSYEVIAFSEQIAQFSDVLAVGKSVIVNVEADDRPDGIGLRLIGAEDIDKAAGKLGKRLEIEANSANCLTAIKAQLKAGDGQVIMVVGRERIYEVELPGRFTVSPEIAGGIRTLDGVVEVRLS